MSQTDTCGGSFADGDELFVCDRDADRHLIHRDANGTKAMKVPGGFLVSRPKCP
ncbi:hypothetical protein [Streptosporangium sandarakinum]|uniref:hypothetical protein n=1 Tax=Streptosporangium sandarakinum TaxID=1260955 RepID=UPI0037232BDB